MTTITLPFVLNRKSGVLEVSYEPNQNAAQRSPASTCLPEVASMWICA
jgi:hypothetical protein